MTLQIPIPENIDEALIQRLDREAREAVAVRLYKEGKLSHGQFADYLQIDRSQAEDVLGRHGIVDYTPERVSEEADAIRQRLKI
jgi:predicted HTH domain antitoxin